MLELTDSAHPSAACAPLIGSAGPFIRMRGTGDSLMAPTQRSLLSSRSVMYWIFLQRTYNVGLCRPDLHAFYLLPLGTPLMTPASDVDLSHLQDSITPTLVPVDTPDLNTCTAALRKCQYSWLNRGFSKACCLTPEKDVNLVGSSCV